MKKILIILILITFGISFASCKIKYDVTFYSNERNYTFPFHNADDRFGHFFPQDSLITLRYNTSNPKNKLKFNYSLTRGIIEKDEITSSKSVFAVSYYKLTIENKGVKIPPLDDKVFVHKETINDFYTNDKYYLKPIYGINSTSGESSANFSIWDFSKYNNNTDLTIDIPDDSNDYMIEYILIDVFDSTIPLIKWEIKLSDYSYIRIRRIFSVYHHLTKTVEDNPFSIISYGSAIPLLD
jgi:hypothetical protein